MSISSVKLDRLSQRQNEKAGHRAQGAECGECGSSGTGARTQRPSLKIPEFPPSGLYTMALTERKREPAHAESARPVPVRPAASATFYRGTVYHRTSIARQHCEAELASEPTSVPLLSYRSLFPLSHSPAVVHVERGELNTARPPRESNYNVL